MDSLSQRHGVCQLAVRSSDHKKDEQHVAKICRKLLGLVPCHKGFVNTMPGDLADTADLDLLLNSRLQVWRIVVFDQRGRIASDERLDRRRRDADFA